MYCTIANSTKAYPWKMNISTGTGHVAISSCLGCFSFVVLSLSLCFVFLRAIGGVDEDLGLRSQLQMEEVFQLGCRNRVMVECSAVSFLSVAVHRG